jgi:hypothetical protein
MGLHSALITLVITLAIAGAPQDGTQESTVPTSIEQALMEHVCGQNRAAADFDTEVYEACLKGQLRSLRADFATDLKGLSVSERKTVDSMCSPIRADRDAYMRCLSDQLMALRNSRIWAKPAPSSRVAVPPASVEDFSTTLSQPAASASTGSGVVWAGAVVVLVLVATSGVVMALKARQAPRICRACATNVPESGDLCQKCRHEAADALRRAAAERAESQPAS